MESGTRGFSDDEETAKITYGNNSGLQSQVGLIDPKLLEDQKIAQLKLRESREPRRTEKNYCYWTNAYEPGNHWNSIKEYEDSKKKKANSPYY